MMANERHTQWVTCDFDAKPHPLNDDRPCRNPEPLDDGLEDANGYSRNDLLFGGNW